MLLPNHHSSIHQLGCILNLNHVPNEVDLIEHCVLELVDPIAKPLDSLQSVERHKLARSIEGLHTIGYYQDPNPPMA